MLLVIGSALLVVALVLLPVAVIGLRRWMRQRGLAQLRPGALIAQAGQRVTLTGASAPGPDGQLLSSGLAGGDCVWHGHEVLRHYWPLNNENGGGPAAERACDSIASYSSEDLFGLAPEGGSDGQSRIFVSPGESEPRGAELCLKRLVGRPQPGVASPADDLLPKVRGRISGIFRGETIEFEYREWVIRPGRRVRITGELQVRDDGRVVLVAPEDGKLSIEHGVADQPTRTPPRRIEALGLTAACAVCAIAGAVLVLTGLSVG